MCSIADSKTAQEFLSNLTGAPECAQFGIREATAIAVFPTARPPVAYREVTLDNGKTYSVMIREVVE